MPRGECTSWCRWYIVDKVCPNPSCLRVVNNFSWASSGLCRTNSICPVQITADLYGTEFRDNHGWDLGRKVFEKSINYMDRVVPFYAQTAEGQGATEHTHDYGCTYEEDKFLGYYVKFIDPNNKDDLRCVFCNADPQRLKDYYAWDRFYPEDNVDFQDNGQYYWPIHRYRNDPRRPWLDLKNEHMYPAYDERRGVDFGPDFFEDGINRMRPGWQPLAEDPHVRAGYPFGEDEGLQMYEPMTMVGPEDPSRGVRGLIEIENMKEPTHNAFE